MNLRNLRVPAQAPSWRRAARPGGGALPGVLLAVGLLLAFSPPLWALTEREVEQKVLHITNQLRCPTCQGLSVKDSGADIAKRMKTKVRRMVEEGQSEEAIKAFFVSRFGEFILRSPKKEGLGLVVWALPGTAILLTGGLLGWRVYRNTRAPADESPAAPPELTAEQRSRIARDLSRYEHQD